MKKLFIYLLSLAFIAAFTQCSKDDTIEDPPAGPETPDQVFIGEEFAIGSGLKIEFYALTELFTGYNTVYFTVKDSITGSVVEADELMMHPMMQMATMAHSCPMEAPVYNSTTKQYEGAISFVMSSMMGTWTVSVHLNNLGTAEFESVVIDPAEAMIYSFPSKVDSSKTYFVSLIQPTDPKVGENDFEILINHKATMMDWPAVEDFSVIIEPEMPDMGHGSPNNVDPTHTADGHYDGVVNFTMTGWWRVNLTIINAEGDTINNDRSFNITF